MDYSQWGHKETDTNERPTGTVTERTHLKEHNTLSHVRVFATQWTIQSMEFSRPEYWSG